MVERSEGQAVLLIQVELMPVLLAAILAMVSAEKTFFIPKNSALNWVMVNLHLKNALHLEDPNCKYTLIFLSEVTDPLYDQVSVKKKTHSIKESD